MAELIGGSLARTRAEKDLSFDDFFFFFLKFYVENIDFGSSPSHLLSAYNEKGTVLDTAAYYYDLESLKDGLNF